MKVVTTILLSLVLSGCAITDAFVRKEVVVETQYVVRKATDQQKMLPAQPSPIDVNTADQSALAEWIVQSERRMMDLESIIKRLVEFYEKPVTEEERKKQEQQKAKSPQPAASK